MVTYNIEIREFNGSDYDILYPKTAMNNVDGLSNALSQINTNIQGVSDRVSTSEVKITQLQNTTSQINTNIQQINSDITSLSQGIVNIQNTVSTLDANKQDKLTFDATPKSGSTNPVTSNGILNALNTKQDKSTLGSLALKDKATLTNGDDVTGVLPVDNGGTGNSTGLAASATKLATARTVRTNLASTSTASFDGSANITPGVTGTLGIPNGGTGASTAIGALQNLGVTISNVEISEGSTLASGSIYIYYE